MSERSKTFVLKPNWKYNLIPYVVSFLLLPVFGIGIIVFLYYWLRLRSIKYIITDNDITIINRGNKNRIPISELDSVSLTRNWTEARTGLGTVTLLANISEYRMIGIDKPEGIREALEIAIANEKHRKEINKKVQGFYPDIKIGGLEEMNDLVGLWQQGLISNEDFEREKNKYS